MTILETRCKFHTPDLTQCEVVWDIKTSVFARVCSLTLSLLIVMVVK